VIAVNGLGVARHSKLRVLVRNLPCPPSDNSDGYFDEVY
jgi:hypothetical protein